MKIPFFTKNNNKTSYFLGLFLKETEGIVLVIKPENGKMTLKEKVKFSFSNGWENLTDDIDEILFNIEKKLDYRFTKTIFFVYSHLVDEKNLDIKKPYLTKIKELVKNLELEALGYIECYDAVSSFLEQKEEIPLTSVLVELDKSQIGIFIYKGGKVSSKKVFARTDNVIDDFLKGFEDFKGKMILPARIILYDSHELDNVSSNIISHRWDEDYFVQIPRVDIFRENDLLDGLINIFSKQIKTTNFSEREIKKTENKPKEVMGFMINQDISKSSQIKINSINIFDKFKHIFTNLPKIDFKLNFNFSGKIFLFVGLLIIIVGLFLNEIFLHKANLTLYLPSQKISSKSSLDLNYKVATSTALYTEEKPTTGLKDIGDSAKGVVTIHNFSDSEKLFTKGTIIDLSNQKFILDSDVKVASSSLTSDGSAKLPGKNTVSVTASSIGPEGNLAKGQRFKISDLPITSYFAINEAVFTGGTKKQVRTVSSKDQEDLETAILVKAKKMLKTPDNIKDYELINNLTKTTLSNSIFSKEVGEEGDKLSLKTNVISEFYGVNKKEILDIIEEELKNKINSGYVLKSNNISYEISKVEKNKEKINANLNITAKAMKDISDNLLIKSLVGKKSKDLEEYLKTKFEIQAYKIIEKNPLPIFKGFLPFFQNNIVVLRTTL